VRILAPEEVQKVEYWARNTQIAKMLTFFDALPRFIQVPKPLLLGSNNESEILVFNDTTISLIRGELANMDEPFNPYLRHQRILDGRRREKPEKALQLLYENLQKGFEKVCLLAETGECSEKIIRAHSLQKSLFKNYAKNGHVYHFEPFTGTHDANKNLWPNLVGINKATTFSGFCERHDSQIFSNIEIIPFQNTPEQRFLYHYRAFAQMYYDKAYKFKVIEKLFEGLAKKCVPRALLPAPVTEYTRLEAERVGLNQFSLSQTANTLRQAA
jgi:hypothetical protein